MGIALEIVDTLQLTKGGPVEELTNSCISENIAIH